VSRYAVYSEDPKYDIVAGYDEPLNYFFAQVEDRTTVSPDPLLYRSPFISELEEFLKHFTTVPEELLDRLHLEKESRCDSFGTDPIPGLSSTLPPPQSIFWGYPDSGDSPEQR
jgi:hypothetical protein